LTPKRRKRDAAAILGVAAAFFCALLVSPATSWAGAWPMKDGEGQAILKYEDQKADTGFDPDGVEVGRSIRATTRPCRSTASTA
jgi:hypothetical protein